jgi:nucleotide-binding universal stress UspA family protein
MEFFMFKRILIPLDGSLLAERAIQHAEQFARIFGAKIVLLRVLEVASRTDNQEAINPLSWQIQKTEADMYLSGVASRIREHLHLAESQSDERKSADDPVEYTIREGRIAENIIDFAHSENIDLLVISSHGMGGLSRWNMSSIVQKVVDLIYLPVLIVRSYDFCEEAQDTIHYRHILLPVDSSRRAECALSAGIMLAEGEKLLDRGRAGHQAGMDQSFPIPLRPNDTSLEPKLFLAAVVTPPEIPLPSPYPLEISKLSEQLLQISREAIHAYLKELKLRLPVSSDIRMVENVNASSGIVELASQEEGIDLVVLCAHGYTGQSTWPYGSVARNYMENGTKSILIIQDVSRAEVRPTAAALAAEKSGRR